MGLKMTRFRKKRCRMTKHENHYKEQMKTLPERRKRRILLEKKLADADVSEEDQNNLIRFIEKKETEYMRLQRHKMGLNDFELLTVIGKGAFVRFFTRHTKAGYGKEEFVAGQTNIGDAVDGVFKIFLKVRTNF